jgi:subtilase family serine protease
MLGVSAVSAVVLAVPGSAAPRPAAHVAVPKVARVCATGFYQCMAYVRTDLTPVAAPAAPHPGYGPKELHSAYELPWKGGKHATIAIVDAYDDPTAEHDLAVYRSYYHLPACTTKNGCFHKVNQDMQSSPLPRPDADWALEESLDLDMVSAICPQCHILFVEASSADETNVTLDHSSDLGHAAAMAATWPGVVAISNSYGSLGVEPDEAKTLDFEYDHPGIAVVVSSGDSGYGAAFPADSKYVIAAGGTSLTRSTNTKRGWTESAWTSPAAGQAIPEVFGAGGSGCSMWESKPKWQKDKGCKGRTIADFAAVADPATGVAIYVSYPSANTPITGWTVVGGTSVSSPILSAVYGLAGNKGVTSSRNVALRYPAERLYTHTKDLWDVTTGATSPAPVTCSGGAYVCQAGKGYDGPTGNGTPHGIKAFVPPTR